MSKEKDNTANHTHDHTHDHDHSHTHDHDHDHHHHDTQLPHEKWSTHYHALGENHGAPGVNDYMKAVRDYRKTWPNKQKVMAETPDPAVRELLYRMEQMGCDTVFDRFDNQQPQCTFGIAGVCCKNCFMGPCRITEKAPRGVCGADADLIVARNMARAAAGGLTQHGAHARELLVALKKAITGEYDHPIVGTRRLIEVATAFGLETEIRGVVNIVGCSNPRVVFEKPTYEIALEMLKNDIVILTNGCASFLLLKMGLCDPDSVMEKCGPGLQAFFKETDMPPVWHVGECVDNAKSSGIFGAITGQFGRALKDMPFAMSSPECSNEKGVCASLGFRLHGINSYHCVEPSVQGSKKVTDFLKKDSTEYLGSVMYVHTDGKTVAAKIIEDINAKRRALGWKI